MSDPTSMWRFRARRDQKLIERRLAELEATGPLDNTFTLGEALAVIQERRNKERRDDE